MNYLKFLLSGLLFSGILNCTNHKCTRLPSNFAFIIQDEQNRYESRTGNLTRFYAGKDSSIQVNLDSVDLIHIYESFEQSNFRNFPQLFEGKCSSIPLFIMTLSFTIGSQQYQSARTEPCDYPLLTWRQVHDFRKLDEAIWQLINEKKVVKAMRPANMISL